MGQVGYVLLGGINLEDCVCNLNVDDKSMCTTLNRGP